MDMYNECSSVSRAENLEPQGLRANNSDQGWQRFAETFQKVTQPRGIAGCSGPASPPTWKAGGDLTGCEDLEKVSSSCRGAAHRVMGGPLGPGCIPVTLTLVPRSLRPFCMQNFESTPERSKSRLAQEREKERVRCQQVPKAASHQGGKEREPLFLKPRFPNCGATKHFRWDKVSLEELQDYIHVH